jgi:pimeloyl-ACP methyl ester carboxylesterase
MHGRLPLVLGYSAGGALALKLAARRQDLQEVVAISVPWGGLSDALRAFWSAPVDREQLASALRAMTAHQEAPDPAVLTARFAPFQCPDYAAYFAEMVADPADCLQRLRLEPDEAASITAHVTLAHGRQDRACPPAQVISGLLPLLPDADMKLYGGCGHAVCTERPTDIGRLLNQLLERPISP